MMTSAAEAVCIGALHKFLDVHMLPNDGVHGYKKNQIRLMAYEVVNFDRCASPETIAYDHEWDLPRLDRILEIMSNGYDQRRPPEFHAPSRKAHPVEVDAGELARDLPQKANDSFQEMMQQVSGRALEAEIPKHRRAGTSVRAKIGDSGLCQDGMELPSWTMVNGKGTNIGAIAQLEAKSTLFAGVAFGIFEADGQNRKHVLRWNQKRLSYMANLKVYQSHVGSEAAMNTCKQSMAEAFVCTEPSRIAESLLKPKARVDALLTLADDIKRWLLAGVVPFGKDKNDPTLLIGQRWLATPSGQAAAQQVQMDGTIASYDLGKYRDEDSDNDSKKRKQEDENDNKGSYKHFKSEEDEDFQ